VAVDQETGFPVHVVATNDGGTVYETRIEGLTVNPSLGSGPFRLEFPTGSEVARSDQGFRRVPLDEVRSRVGYDPLVPADVPEGYELAEVSVSQKPVSTGVEGANPLVGDV